MAGTDNSLTVLPFGACPVPKSRYEHILLGHGSGGQLTADLIQRLFVPAFANDVLGALEDQATLLLPSPPLTPHPSPPKRGRGEKDGSPLPRSGGEGWGVRGPRIA